MALNRMLYAALQRRFGTVIYANEGQAAEVKFVLTLRGAVKEGRTRGEFYRVNCPYCNDTRHRLYISYLWGVVDNDEGRRNMDLAHCFNMECMSKDNRRSILYAELFAYTGGAGVRAEDIKPGRVVSVADEVPPPGVVTAINSLAPDHYARRYLAERGYDCDYLWQYFKVGFCERAAAEYPLAEGRIVIPTIFNGLYAGWQTRVPADLDWKAVRLPKYYNSNLMSKSQILYNYDNARLYNFAVLVEGATDVWRVGPQGVSVLGSHISGTQLQLLGQLGQVEGLAVLFDNDEAGRTAAERYVPHLQGVLPGKVWPVFLPEGCDPGSTPTIDLWERIYSTVGRRDLHTARELSGFVLPGIFRP